ncbi:hypothetical protein TNCT_672511 [Trichonephila clavata]|uniref:Transmembrane protein n=1 Tax=Trichonephila clavata TaxID=2740835 RepID=A0A8X6GKR7_TRICU|nr:hypothetical protein TNCT_672511 [Trichonephila clavata]
MPNESKRDLNFWTIIILIFFTVLLLGFCPTLQGCETENCDVVYICRTIFLLQCGALILYLVFSTWISRKDSRQYSAESATDEKPTIEENDLESSEITTKSETGILSTLKNHSLAFEGKQKNGVIQASSNQTPWQASRATYVIVKIEPADTEPVGVHRLSTTDLNVCNTQCREESSKDIEVNLTQIKQISLNCEVKQSSNEDCGKKYQ